MQIQIKKTKENNIIQITTSDERWYIKEEAGENIGDETIKTFVPSVTWIASHYPKGIGYMKWLSQNGWDESQALMKEAGDRGSKVHKAIEELIDGKELKMTDRYYSELTKQEEEFTVEEWECIMSFHSWFTQVNPEPIACEIVVFDDEVGYAGTVDCICIIRKDAKIGRQLIKKGIYIIDWKTSQDIWASYEIQISAYKNAIPKEIKEKIWNSLSEEEQKDEEFQEFKLAILQIGYRRNGNGFKFNLIEDQFDLFLSTYKIWEKECGSICPRQIDYPLTLKL
jgi:hypothetical protein